MGHRILYIPKPVLVADEFISEWNMPTGNFTLPLITGFTYNFTVDWGDGSALSTVTAYNDTDATHAYTAGTYQIKIKGQFPHFRINNGTVKTYLTKIIQWGNVGFTSFLYTFYGCSNLAVLPNSPITGCNAVITIAQAFQGCTGLTTIPTGFFDNLVNAKDFTATFYLCTGISSIPTGLLDNCISAEVFTSMFRQTGLTSIPSGLLDNCPNVTTMSYMFYNSTSLTGSSRLLWLNPSGSGIYTLTSPNYDSGVPDGLDCYRSCTGLSDYATIPTFWK
jgi:hypothetical protein